MSENEPAVPLSAEQEVLWRQWAEDMDTSAMNTLRRNSHDFQRLFATIDVARARAKAAEQTRDALWEVLADVLRYAPSGPPWDLFQQRVLRARTTLTAPAPDGGDTGGTP